MTDEKLVLKLKTQINNIRFEELSKILEKCGYVLVRQKGSHCFFENDEGKGFTIPKTSPVKTFYVKIVLNILREQNK